MTKNTKMKILFICENYIPHYGGVEVVFKNLAEGYVQQGHTVSLLTQRLQSTPAKEVIGGVTVERVFSFFTRYLFTFLAIPKAMMLAGKHDLIQTTTFNGAFPAWLAGKITKKPVTITVHEVWVGKWPSITAFPSWKCKLHDFLERMIYLLPFDHYICVSQATKDDLLRRGIKKEKIDVVYNGLDYEFWNPAKVSADKIKELRQTLEVDTAFAYLSWGRPGESKGFEYAIKAVPAIAQEVPNSVFLLMLGSTNKYSQKYQRLVNLINSLNLNDKIKLIPSVPYTELRNYIKAVDCVVVPSTAEGFGYTAVETIAMGTPIVVSNAGSLPEVVSGKHLIFKNKDAGDLAAKVIAIAHKKYDTTEIQRFEWKRSIGQYLKIYGRLVERCF
ncbi:MAG: glycosyltransferase family 4 protein [Nanoarchaeota archaeon]|nr:glycosyltransferase family 4 protein [Nanoarchaeota archaeon]